jgi:hypothetical protein
LSIAPGIGQHQILFAFDLPYDRKLDFDLSAPVPVEAAIVMVPPAGVRLKSEQLVDAGERNVQGMAFQMYQAVNSLSAGQKVHLTLSGKAGEDVASTGENPLALLLTGLGIFGAVVAGGGYWLYRQRKQLQLEAAGAGELEPAPLEDSDSILETILTLDDQFAAGSLPEAVYFERRAELKERLAEALAREENGE